MPHLLIWTLGPVQDFIKTARKARDLWFGSWLLAELSRTAALACVEHESLDALIFPAPRSVEKLRRSDYDVPNRIMAQLRDPEAAARCMTDAARARLRALAEQVMDEVQRHAPRGFRRDMALAQVDDLLEVAWAHVPLGPGDQYSQRRAQAERLLAARKSCREFQQPSWAGHLPKSSLDGAREAVLNPRKLGPRRRLALSLKPRESLSGVDLLKRVGGRLPAARNAKGGRIDSTTHVAARSYTLRLADRPQAAQELLDYLDLLPAHLREASGSHTSMGPGLGRQDGGLLYPNRIDEDELLSAEQRQRILGALKHLLGSWREATGRSVPSPYYAVLLADGDRLGAHISQLGTVEEQRSLGRTLTRFAAQAREIVEQRWGQVVYAGGDDLLALLPVCQAFEAADQLRLKFRQELGGPTLSVASASATTPVRCRTCSRGRVRRSATPSRTRGVTLGPSSWISAAAAP